MKFMDGPFYKQEVQDLEDLQNKVEQYHALLRVTGDIREVKIEYLHTLYALVEKEQGLFVRLQLDGSEEAHKIMDELTEQAHESGVPPHYSLPEYHYSLKRDIKIELEALGQDLDDPVNLD